MLKRIQDQMGKLVFVTCFYCCPDLQGVLCNEVIFQAAAKDAFPQYNKDQMLAIELSDGSGHVCYLSISIIHIIERGKHWITWSFSLFFQMLSLFPQYIWSASKR